MKGRRGQKGKEGKVAQGEAVKEEKSEEEIIRKGR